VDPVQQFAFVVGLAEFDFKPQLFGAAAAQGSDVGQGFMAVGGGFAGAEQVEVGPLSTSTMGGIRGISTVLVGCGNKMYWLVNLVN